MNNKNLVSSQNKDAKLAVRQNYARPAVDIYEQEHGLTLVADLPGVKSESLQIDLDQGVLSLEAETSVNLSGESLFHEFATRGFYRQFRLPDNLNMDKIVAQLDNGVLTLELPKVDQVKPKRIEVKTLH